MRSSKTLTLALATAGCAVLAAVAAPADAADTPVTFTVAAGTLSISAPSTTATLAAAGALTVDGTSVTGQLGSTTVTDARGTALHSVTVTMSSTAFAKSGAASIPATAATGYSGVATPSGTAAAVPTITGLPLDGTGSTILTLNSVLGAGGATYNPTVSVTVPASAVAGIYTGTITQTVA